MTSKPNTFAEINLGIFTGNVTNQVLWQPRLEYWYEYNKAAGTLPSHMKGFSLIDLYDYCHASIRYFTNPLCVRYINTQVSERMLEDNQKEVVYETPLGRLREVVHYDEYKLSPYRSEHPLKTVDDFKINEYLLFDQQWYWDQNAFEADMQKIAGRGAPQFYFRRSPIQRLFIEKMGFENAIYMMNDHPKLIEHYVEVVTEADEAMYKVLCECPVDILNFGENIDCHMDSPKIWDKHLAPYYHKRHQQLKQCGKFTHIHVDGSMKHLISQIRESPFDGIEACTPKPQGDVTLEEIKYSVGDRIFLDGIPAIYFLPLYSLETCLDHARQVIDMFSPKLILGISDEMPPDGDIERVRIMGELIKTGNL